MKLSMKGSLASASKASGVPCRTMRPSRKIAILSAIFTASSMSWLTKMIVFLRRDCIARNSSCSASRDKRIERAERLVHQQDRRIGGERAGNADALRLPARQLARIAPGVVSGIEPDHLEQLERTLVPPFDRPAQETRNDADVLLDRHVRKQADLLDHVADLPAQRDRVELARVLAVDEHPPAGGSRPGD